MNGNNPKGGARAYIFSVIMSPWVRAQLHCILLAKTLNPIQAKAGAADEEKCLTRRRTPPIQAPIYVTTSRLCFLCFMLYVLV